MNIEYILFGILGFLILIASICFIEIWRRKKIEITKNPKKEIKSKEIELEPKWGELKMEREIDESKKGYGGLVVGLIVIIIILLFVLAGGPKITGNIVKNVGCKQVTEYTTEYRTEEYKVGTKNCDRTSGCSCIHKSWGGLGACDSCTCTKRVSVQVPYTREQCAWDD